MSPTKPSAQAKRARVIGKNTFYFFDNAEQERHESHIHSLRETLARLKNRVESRPDEEGKKRAFDELLAQSENGLRALLALTGVSNESLKRVVTLARICDDREFDRVINKSGWLQADDKFGNRGLEWGDAKIARLIRENPDFRRGVVNLFFEGASVPFLSRTLPLFELRKFSLRKLAFDSVEMLDTLARYKEKGAHSARGDNNPETVIAGVIEASGLPFEKGDLPKLAAVESHGKRAMDFIIPDKREPKLVIECSYLSTTSSGQGDKAKTERNIRDLLARHYPGCRFFGFLDGIGWLVRTGDLLRMVDAFDDVFTLHKDELARFSRLLEETANGVK